MHKSYNREHGSEELYLMLPSNIRMRLRSLWPSCWHWMSWCEYFLRSLKISTHSSIQNGVINRMTRLVQANRMIVAKTKQSPYTSAVSWKAVRKEITCEIVLGFARVDTKSAIRQYRGTETETVHCITHVLTYIQLIKRNGFRGHRCPRCVANKHQRKAQTENLCTSLLGACVKIVHHDFIVYLK